MMKKIFTFFAALACTVSMFAATETVYFVNAQNWTGTINAYAWTSASNAQWPGVPATKEAEKIAGCDVYSYTAEAGTYANVIFNNGSGQQTADLKWTAGKYYCKDGWYTKEDAAAKLGQPVEYESVYFVNVDSWANVKIYTWTPEVAAWPGEDMKKEATKLADKEVWSYTVEKGTTFVGMLFNDGTGTQTSDLKWESGKYFVKDNWYTKEEAEAKLSGNTPETPETPVTPGETKDITVKAKVPAAWTDQITAWVWATGGAGQEVVPTQEGEWYVYTQNCAELNIIFKNGAGWNGDANQTVDITVTESACVEITSDGATKATYTLVDCEGGTNPENPNPETPVTGAYYVTGTADLVGADKAWNETAIAMTYDESNADYTHTFVGLVADLEYKLKVTNGTWNQSWGYKAVQNVPAGVTGDADGNVVFTLAEAGDVVVTFNGTNMTIAGNFKVTDTPVVPQGTNYVLMGVGGDWTTGIALEVNPDNAEEYQLLCQTISDGDAVKVVTITDGKQTAWCGNVEEASVAHTADDMGNVVLAPGIYDFYFKAAADIMYIGKAACDTTGTTPENPETPETPVTGAYYVTGTADLVGADKAWNETAIAMTYDESNADYTHTFVGLVADLEYKLKVTNGTWNQSWGYKAVQNVPAGVTGDADGNVVFTLAEAGDVVVTFNGTNMTIAGSFKVTETPTPPTPGETKDITVKAKVPAAWTDQITAWVWATGGEGQEVVPTQEGEWYVYTQNCTELNIIFKNGAGWNGDANQTVDITVTESTCVEITADGVTKATYTIVDCEGGDTPVDPTPGETKDITVKAKVPATWTDQITAWVWATGGEGQEVIPTQEGEWYVVTHNCAELNIIFKNGAGWNGDANQTVDITGITESTCIEITADGVTKATYTVVNCEGGDTPVDPNPGDDPVVPGETKTIYLNTGGAQLWNQDDAKFFVHAWGGAADLDAQMTLVAGDIYQVEIAHTSIIFLRLAPAATGVVWEGENLWNKTADLEILEGKNCYTITGWGETDGTWSTYTPPTTDNEQVVINKKATKIVYNGQVCVIRDGVIFNVLGQVIK